MKNLEAFESYNLSESDPGDETPMYIDEAIKAILPIMEDYYRGVDASGGDPDNAIEYFKEKLIQAIQSMPV